MACPSWVPSVLQFQSKHRRVLIRAVQIADELIRQVTLNLPERGLLLMRVRDEMKLTISAYNTL